MPTTTRWLLVSDNDPERPPGDAVWTVGLDGLQARTAAEFFVHAAERLEFPEYFGANWGAFDECLSDLLDISDGGMGHAFGGRPGHPATHLHVRLDHGAALLSAEPVGARRTLVAIVRDCAASAADDQTASLVVSVAPTGSNECDGALRDAGVVDDDLAS